MSLLYLTHSDCLAHEMLPGHPESPDRLRAIHGYLKDTGLLKELKTAQTRPAPRQALARVHSETYLRALDDLSPTQGLVSVDPDTTLNPFSLNAARQASGSLLQAVEAVTSGEADRAFCAVRPPGHHAEAGAAMGFCFYNSIAVGAAHALTLPGIDRVAILDFDVHHGNGSVDIFKDRDEVLVCSSFQHPYYPHRYADIERGNIINTPLPAGSSGALFRTRIEEDWWPALARHQPQLILVSAGFDAHRDDPLAGLALEDADFAWVTRLIVDAAHEFCSGRVVSTLEGGYDLNALARCVHAHLEVLLEG
jgi:acetoin utilization deacetylase AcuC-like enzyme